MDPEARIEHLLKLLRKASLGKCRKSKRACKEEEKSREDKEWLEMIGYGYNPLKGRQYTDDHLRIIQTIGSCPSPGGSMAPLARVASHLKVSMTQIVQNIK